VLLAYLWFSWASSGVKHEQKEEEVQCKDDSLKAKIVTEIDMKQYSKNNAFANTTFTVRHIRKTGIP
jgi:hypothetical protein